MKKPQMLGMIFLLVAIIAAWVILTNSAKKQAPDSSLPNEPNESGSTNTQVLNSSDTPHATNTNAVNHSDQDQPLIATQTEINIETEQSTEAMSRKTSSDPGFSTLIDAANQNTITYPDAPEIVRTRTAVINPSALPDQITMGQPVMLDLPLFPDKNLKIEIHDIQNTIGDTTVYSGKIAGESLQTIALTAANGILLGDIMDLASNRQYKISYNSKSGEHTITEYDPTKMPTRTDLPALVPPEGE